MNAIPRFVPDSSKALEVILWFANASPHIDVYHLVKACFFADKAHVAKHGRAIAGDNYDAAPYGPLPQVVYGILKRDYIDLLALGGNGDVPFAVNARLEVIPDREPNLRKLSPSDVEAMEHGLRSVRGRSFNAIFQETHADPAYVKAEGNRLDPRDFLSSDDPDRDAKAQDLIESAEYVVYGA